MRPVISNSHSNQPSLQLEYPGTYLLASVGGVCLGRESVGTWPPTSTPSVRKQAVEGPPSSATLQLSSNILHPRLSMLHSGDQPDAPTVQRARRRRRGTEHICEHCDRTFKRSEHLQRHVRTRMLLPPQARDARSPSLLWRVDGHSEDESFGN